MGELREIVDLRTVEKLFILLAILAPILGLILGAAVGARRKEVGRGALSGLLVGLFGPLNWLLWRMYNALTDRNGLDTVRNLFINLAIFIGLGSLLGAGIGWMRRRNEASETPHSPTPSPARGEGESSI